MQQPTPTTNKSGTQANQKPGVHSFLGSQSRSARRAGGFTTVELMVVVGIIILLLGIGLVAGTRFVAEGKRVQTRSMMDGLLGANTEFQAQRQQGSVNHDGRFPIDWTKSDVSKYNNSIERFVYACSQVKAVEDQMTNAVVSAGKKSVERTYKDSDNDGVKEVYDPWGTLIEYRSFNNGEGKGPGTNVANNLLPLSKSPFFVSAGQDKKFGTEDDITTIDNPIYKN